MTELPSGTVTLLFTDIEGSTQLLQRLGSHYGDVLAEYRALLRSVFAQHAGQEVVATRRVPGQAGYGAPATKRCVGHAART